MRKARLMTATALALTLTGVPLLAIADTTISNETTNPVKTSDTGKLTVAAAGSLKLTSGTAITVDSDHDVTLNGNINMLKAESGAKGIFIDGGRTSDLIVAGKIHVLDDYTATDKGDKNGTAPDGLIDHPYAQGTGRYGIHSRGTTAFVGDVDIRSIAEILVDGDESYGVRFENRIDGAFTNDGSISITGDDSVGISLEDGATGRVYLSGKVLARGENTSAARLSGDFDSVLIDGEYVATAYWSPTPTQKQIDNALPENKLQGGPAVDITGNVAKGIWLSTTKANTVDSNTDEDGNGVPDNVQTRADIASYGQAPALRIASATEDLTIGGIVYGSTAISPPAVNYGLYVQGNILGSGLFPGISATGVQLGGRGHAVTIANGAAFTGQVLSVASQADATSVAVLDGAQTPLIDVGSNVRATVATAEGHTARGIFIDEDASVSTINVNQGGAVLALTTGSKGNATAITDLSGTVTTITNKAGIEAYIYTTDADNDGTADPRVNRPVAIDVRANTTGVTLTQIDPAPGDTDADKAVPPPMITGDVLFGSGNDVMALNGGSMTGNVVFGAGSDSLTVNNASLTGDVNFGTGSNSLSIDGKGSIIGRLSGDGTVSVNVGEGSLGMLEGSALKASTFTVSEKGTVTMMLDTANPGVAPVQASGIVTFADGAKLNLLLSGILVEPERFTVITGSQINLGAIGSSDLASNTPWLYVADLSKNTDNTALYADFRLKSQSELSMSDNEYGALDPILRTITDDTGATYEMLTRMNREDFNNLYNQYLPDHSGENLITLARGSQALNRTLSDLTVIPRNTNGQYWLHEETFNTEREYGSVNGFEAGGFIVSGGRERAFGSYNMAGVYLSFVSSTPYDSFSIAGEKLINTDMTIGAYWRYNKDNLRLWVHGGAGYVSLESHRELITQSVSHRSNAKWNGRSLTAGLGAAYDYKAGSFLFGPKVMLGYYGLKEDGYTETGGGQYFDLDIDDRDSHLLSGTALLNVTFDRWFIKPEVWVGWKQNISADVSPTMAAFQNGNSFTLDTGDLSGGGPIAGFRIRADNAWSYFAIESEYEDVGPYKGYSISLKTRFQF